MHMYMGIFVNQEKIHPYSVFSPFWRKNFLVGPGRKHLGPTVYFPSSPSNQTHFKNFFLLIFSPKFSIFPVSPPNKQTLRIFLSCFYLGPLHLKYLPYLVSLFLSSHTCDLFRNQVNFF